MSRTFPLEITLNEFTEDTVNAVTSEIEEAIENLRKYHSSDVVKHITDVDIDQLLAKNDAAAVIWTADDIRKVVPHLSDDQALAVIADCFRIFSPEETANREMIFEVAKRLYPNLTCKERSNRANQAVCAYARGSARDNLLALLTDARHWCDANDESFADLNHSAYLDYQAKRTKTGEGSV